jgi:multiple sugar transport system ATP-binding protein
VAEVRLVGVGKRFGKAEVIRGVDLQLRDGEFVVFVGPSGCGKSTLLRLIAGLEDVSRGEILIDGVCVNDKKPKERGIAMVFQSYALYPHMKVFDNMAFGLELAGRSKAQIAQRVLEAARVLELTPLLQRLPKELSGGQRQRVAIGRAIVRDPKVFLFDEPLSNLDAALRVQMRIEIAGLHQRLRATMVYVTHDQVEAMTLADRIVVLNDGCVEQEGSPLELYHRPANRFVAGFIGSPQMNFIDAAVEAADAQGATLTLAGGARLRAAVDGSGLRSGDRVSLGVRPEHLRAGPAAQGDAALPACCVLVEQLGESHLLHADLLGAQTPPARVTVRAPGDGHTQPGAELSIGVPAEHCHVFAADGRAVPRRMVVAAPTGRAG